MIRKIFYITFLLVPFLSFAQDILINKGEIIKDRQFLIDKTEITACDENGNFVSVRPHRINGTLRNYFIEFFDKLDFIERQEIETENSTEILEVFIKNNKVHVLIKEIDNKYATIRIDLFDLTTKKFVKKNLISAEKDSEKVFFDALKYNNQISVIHDDNYLLNFPVVDDNIAFTYLEFFDGDLNSQSYHEIYPNKNIHRKNTTFLNVSQYNNKTYILYSLHDEKDGNYYQLTEYSNNETRDLILPIEADTYQLINTLSDDESFIINGLFSKKKKGTFEGFSYYKVNLNRFELTSYKISDFHSEDAKKYFIGLFKSNRSIDIKELFIDKEQNTYLIGQFYSIRHQQVPIGIPIASFASSSFTAFITYNPFSVSYKVYDDILISKINSSGELIWDKILEIKETEKIDVRSNKQDSSYFAYFENNQLNILMNGYIDMDKDKLIVKQDKRNSKTNFYNITVNNRGEITPKIIFPNADSDILFRAEGSLKFNNTILNLGQGNMTKQLLKLDF
ncbi:hypothetical protein ACFQ0I_00650 [Mariniflexile aquimaris]|uniref:WG repeat protein n=1 Tax=Mariniflexile aquimaris TaxID=881009 RepID=A0ABW3BMG1_9FLAO